MDELVSAALSITDSTGFALDCFHTNAFFSSPDSITSLSVVDSPSLQFMVGGNNDTSAQLVSAGQLKEVLQRLPRLEALNWRSSIPPPDGLCELIATHCPRVTRFICEPQHYQLSSVRLFLPKWDAPSLPLLSGLGLTTLYLSQLTQAGSQAFASLLRSIAEVSSLEVLTIDFVWLDDALCELIAEAGKKLKQVDFRNSRD
ncbi:hypothetical protein DL96DRAFT_1182978 [Flagelloscypha sp. PMI_526]|nr:hypothetical protein DL96DRAFT_1182978 [Flagelloscypha sp. PMI_526]